MSGDKNPFAKFLKHFDQGTVLFNEGDEGEDMYIIQSGKVAIKKKVGDGDTTLAVLEKGDFFGEMAILERLPRSAGAEVIEGGDLIVINGETFGDMIKANPEIAVRMLRKYSIRLRETNRQVEMILARSGRDAQETEAAIPAVAPPPTSSTVQAEALAYFISGSSGNVFPIFKSDCLIGRLDSVTGMRPDIDLTNEDQSRNVSRRHARLVVRDGKCFVAEEIGTMNGTYLNGKKLPNGVLTPIQDGDELTLCRLPLTFKVAAPALK
ncbi:MAG: cyclic nucleotide-binding domain-containing protein [Vicinamibacteria bacterium]|jgi:CRP-like cAMP-binding protein|nr:cyclic nucleotide-binding domain-containing protein [Vicinamibacteria bacterium]